MRGEGRSSELEEVEEDDKGDDGEEEIEEEECDRELQDRSDEGEVNDMVAEEERLFFRVVETELSRRRSGKSLGELSDSMRPEDDVLPKSILQLPSEVSRL